MHNISLSIITINFNQAKGLEETIRSVVAQSFDNYQYLVIDGGSTDESVNVIERYKDKIHHWVSEKDNGIYNAMNKGIAAAKGEYILFLNSGDVLISEKALQDFVLHQDFKGDIIYGDYQFANGQKIYPDKVTPYYFVKSSLPHQSTFFKRSIFDIMGVFDESYRIAADRAFYLKCMVSNQFQWQHIHYPLTIFDLEGISNSSGHLKKKQVEDERLLQENLGVFYSDYQKMLALEKELNDTKRKTLKGILKRMVTKSKRIWKSR